MKTLGIIGGLGPETTAEFYLEVIFGCRENKIIPEIIIDSISADPKMEREAIVEGKGEERYIPILIKSAQKLERAGADFLVIPCNSLHAFIGEIRNSVTIPILSILEETVDFLKKNGVSEVGLISTVITKRHKLYKNSLEYAGIKTILSDELEQTKINKIIHNLVINRRGNKEREELMKIVENFQIKGLRDIILACTDLQLLIPKHRGMKIHDTMKILADAAVREILK